MAKQRIAEQILEHAEGRPEGTPIVAKNYLHLGNRATMGHALSSLAKWGHLFRAGRGIYLVPITSRYGKYSPSIELTVKAIARQRGEVIVLNGAAAANRLGLTTQNPLRMIFLTSGRSRKLKFGMQVVEIRHAPRWQLTLAHKPAGEVIRALDWLGPQFAGAALKKLTPMLPPDTFSYLQQLRRDFQHGSRVSWLMQRMADAYSEFLCSAPQSAGRRHRSIKIDLQRSTSP